MKATTSASSASTLKIPGLFSIQVEAALWRRLGQAGVLLTAIWVNFWALSNVGYGNEYYAAAVKSMLQSWHNFFFVSFDPGGFVTVDKPPVALWLQTLSAKIFGFNGVSLMLPEAIAGIIAVVVLYHLVRRIFGEVAGLLAALCLAISPVSAAVNRNNLMDGILVMIVVIAAWAAFKATETGELRWLLLTAALVGLGFNTKMLEAYLVLPAFLLVYLLGAPHGWGKRFLHLGMAGVVLVVISLSWVVAVDSTPASQRPYVGSSQTNSELELALGYNGIQRLTGNLFGGGRRGGSTARPTGSTTTGTTTRATTPMANGFFAGETGSPGIFRLFNTTLGGQIGWLLPLALFALLASIWHIGAQRIEVAEAVRQRNWRGLGQTLLSFRLTRRQQSWVLWGMWLLTMAIFFSVAGFFHSYYLSMMAPGVAALAGIGMVGLWRDYRQNGWQGWLLPLTIVVTVLVQAHLLADYPNWSHWLTPLLLVVGFVAAIALTLARIVRLPTVPSWLTPVREGLNTLKTRLDRAELARFVADRRVLPGVVIVALAVLLIAPLAWTATTVIHGNTGVIPTAGPAQPNNPLARAGGALNPTQNADTKLIQFLETHQGKAKFLVATSNAMSAEALILTTGQPVMAMGGFSGSDPILTTQSLKALVQAGQVRYFLVQGGFSLTSAQLEELPPALQEILKGGGRGFGGFGQSGALTSWITSTCKSVPTSQWSNATTTASTANGTGRPAGTGETPPTGGGFPDGNGNRGGGFGGFGRGGSQQLYDCGAVATTKS